MDHIFMEVQETREEGQAEYAHDTKNAFANFAKYYPLITSLISLILFIRAIKSNYILVTSWGNTLFFRILCAHGFC